ncbi:MAG: 4Fe-4S dicluster domain-containing protein [Elusimicrobia bacterium]|nr:4Fe-4S dicluster domain-containing protein [Elusimicrobiota bacterium]MBU2614406.1 4Fe-4S dicluster domain-containing protein [Elusimicrobiota bacterium]
MKYPKLRELGEAIKAVFKGPYTNRFPYEPHTPEKRFRGKPIPNEKGCIGCGACAEVCPANAIEVLNENNKRKVIWHYDLCIFCAQCERLCTTQEGVKLSNTEYDLSVFDRKTLFSEVEKELLICQKCGEIIAPVDQLLWTAKKLGPMAYGNYVLLTNLQQQLGVSQNNIPNPDIKGTSRADLFKLSCPKCRRAVHLFDEYGIK